MFGWTNCDFGNLYCLEPNSPTIKFFLESFFNFFSNDISIFKDFHKFVLGNWISCNWFSECSDVWDGSIILMEILIVFHWTFIISFDWPNNISWDLDSEFFFSDVISSEWNLLKLWRIFVEFLPWPNELS